MGAKVYLARHLEIGCYLRTRASFQSITLFDLADRSPRWLKGMSIIRLLRLSSSRPLHIALPISLIGMEAVAIVHLSRRLPVTHTTFS